MRACGGKPLSANQAIRHGVFRKSQHWLALIEWKYTESYGGSYLGFSKSGTDRRKIYQHLFDDPDCVVDTDLLPDIDVLYYEPFYQFMRQQFLAAVDMIMVA